MPAASMGRKAADGKTAGAAGDRNFFFTEAVVFGNGSAPNLGAMAMIDTSDDRMTEEELRAAMRDDRYWDRGDPEWPAYVQRVTEGWQRLSAEADPSEADAGGPVVILMGGLADRTLDGPVIRGRDAFETANPGVTVEYFTHDQAPNARALIEALPPRQQVVVLAHSWGADAAAELAAALGPAGRRLNYLITVDPVRREPPPPDNALFERIRAGADNWTNLNATGGSAFEPSNLIAGIGRDYGTGPDGFAHRHINVKVPHYAFWDMLRRSNALPLGLRVDP